MDTPWIVAAATPAAFAAMWLLMQLQDLDFLRPVRRVLRWAARCLVVVAMLSPPAFAAALLWAATQESERIGQLIAPMLEGITPTTTTQPTHEEP